MSERRIGNVARNEIDRVIQRIEEMIRARGLKVEPGSVLEARLATARTFAAGPIKFTAATGSDEDEQAVAVGREVLWLWQLWESLDALDGRTPTLTERLVDLVRQQAGDPEREQEFYDTQYELFSAADFAKSGTKVNLMSKDQESNRFVKRVEFLLKHAHPVECKRPRGRDSVLENLKKAAVKVDERAQPGLVCLSFDNVIHPRKSFLEEANVNTFDNAVGDQLQAWWRTNQTQALALIKDSPVRAVVIHVTKCLYTHDDERVGLPTIREAFLASGQWIRAGVVGRCLSELELTDDGN